MTDGATVTIESRPWDPAVNTILDPQHDPESLTAKTRVGRRSIESRAVKHDREGLYSEFQPLVRRLIRQYGEDPESRCDLQGEIYYRFCLLLDAFDPSRGIPLRPYLVRQLTSSVYTYARQRWRRQKREVHLDISLNNGEPAVSADPSRQWDEEMVTKQVLRMLPESIASLPPRQRKLIVWRYYDSMSFEEIAALLNIQVSTARSILRHGLNNLRKTIGRSDLASE